jgi:hypothetical protein
MYAAAVSRLLGGTIETEVLTKFMLYLNGFALIPLVGMAVAGIEHPWIFAGCLVLWLYALFVLPQTALPKLFGVSRARLGFAQAGATVANAVMIVGMIAVTGVAADLLGGIEHRAGRASTASVPFDPRASGISAVKHAAESTVFPVDTLGALAAELLKPGWLARRDAAARAAVPYRRKVPGTATAPAGSTLFPLDTLRPRVRFPADAYGTERGEPPRRGRLRGSGPR